MVPAAQSQFAVKFAVKSRTDYHSPSRFWSAPVRSVRWRFLGNLGPKASIACSSRSLLGRRWAAFEVFLPKIELDVELEEGLGPEFEHLDHEPFTIGLFGEI